MRRERKQWQTAEAVAFAFPRRFGINPEILAAEAPFGAALVFLFELSITEGIREYPTADWIVQAFVGSPFQFSGGDWPEALAAEAVKRGILEVKGDGWILGGIVKAGAQCQDGESGK